MPKDLHELPRLSDSICYIYVEHSIIEQQDSSIVLLTNDGRIPVPIASTCCLLIGPGTSVTHAAIKAICDNGCLAVWCGEKLGRFYATGMGETRSSQNLLRQAALCMDENAHLEVVKRMYARRFPKLAQGEKTLEQLRGMEGIRMKETYKTMSRMTGVPWHGRDYKTTAWDKADPINQALSVANVLLYSVCQAAIVSLGYSPALGFIHTGKMLSFVYDVADLYKTDITIPAAFEAVRDNINPHDLDSHVRINCRKRLESIQLLKRIPIDLASIFNVSAEEQMDVATTGSLWNEESVNVPGGKNYGGDL